MDQANTFPTADHDLLIEVNTIVKNLDSTVKSYAESTSTNINDHEVRLRKLEGEMQTMSTAIDTAHKARNNAITVMMLVTAVAGVIISLLAIKH